jgi:hypothetical protein
VEINDAYDDVIDLKWVNNKTVAHFKANLKPTLYNRLYRKEINHKMSFFKDNKLSVANYVKSLDKDLIVTEPQR